MSLVSEERWKGWMGDMPMPEGCTSEMMWVMYDTIKRIEDKEYAAEQIEFYESLWRKNIRAYTLLEKHKDEDEVFMIDYKNMLEVMKLIKEGIVFYRKWLSE